jgi:hypothetical protein
MRTVEIQNPELFNLVKENNVHLVKIRAILDEGEKLEKAMEEVKKKYQKAQTSQTKTLEKLKPVAIATTSGIECGEFEYIKDVEIKDEKLVANIEDALENWKVAYKEKTSTLSKVKEAQK